MLSFLQTQIARLAFFAVRNPLTQVARSPSSSELAPLNHPGANDDEERTRLSSDSHMEALYGLGYWWERTFEPGGTYLEELEETAAKLCPVPTDSSQIMSEWIPRFHGALSTFRLQTATSEDIRRPEVSGSDDMLHVVEDEVLHHLCRNIFAFFGRQNITLPKHQINEQDESAFVYDFRQVRYWFMNQYHQAMESFKDHNTDETVSRLREICGSYQECQGRVVSMAESLASTSPALDIRSREEGKFIWQRLLLVQIVGEHLGYILQALKTLIDHKHDHKLYIRNHQLAPQIISMLSAISLDWGSNLGLSKFRRQLNRCPTEESFIRFFSKAEMSTLQAQTQEHVTHLEHAGMPFPWVSEHDQCDRKKTCILAHGASGTPRHIESHCSSPCAMRGVPLEHLQEAMEQDSIPLCRLVRSRSEGGTYMDLQPERYKEGMKYIAISHVWADGRGNEAVNELPECQLSYIYDILEQSGNNLPIWMDTLCIPAREMAEETITVPMRKGSQKQVRIKDETAKKLRTNAVVSMNRIYLGATRVIVLCNELLDRWYYAADLDIFLAIRTCSWARRWWTFQEGVFGGDNLYLGFKNTVISFSQIHCYLRPFGYQSPIYEFGLDTPRLFYQIRDMLQTQETGKVIRTVLRECRWRDTQWLEDEPIIMAGILGLNTKSIAEVPWDTPFAAEKKLEILLSRVHSFPTNVLYSKAKKLRTLGLSWVPRSLKIDDLKEIDQGSFLPGYQTQEMGRIHSDGLRFWARMVVFHCDMPLPRDFQLVIDYPSCKDQAAPKRIRFQVQSLIEEPSEDADNKTEDADPGKVSASDNGDEVLHAPFHLANLKYANKPEEKGQNCYAIILRTFDRELFEKYEWSGTQAAIVRVVDGEDLFMWKCGEPIQVSVWKRLTTLVNHFQSQIVGRYLSPAAVCVVPTTSSPDAAERASTSEGTSANAQYKGQTQIQDGLPCDKINSPAGSPKANVAQELRQRGRQAQRDSTSTLPGCSNHDFHNASLSSGFDGSDQVPRSMAGDAGCARSPAATTTVTFRGLDPGDLYFCAVI